MECLDECAVVLGLLGRRIALMCCCGVVGCGVVLGVHVFLRSVGVVQCYIVFC